MEIFPFVLLDGCDQPAFCCEFEIVNGTINATPIVFTFACIVFTVAVFAAVVEAFASDVGWHEGNECDEDAK